jgi:hypothetical protein
MCSTPVLVRTRVKVVRTSLGGGDGGGGSLTGATAGVAR